MWGTFLLMGKGGGEGEIEQRKERKKRRAGIQIP